MLFKNITEIKTFLPIGAGNDFNRLKPHIENAENKYVKPLLGVNMYDELQEFYDADYPETPTEVQEATKELLTKVQHATIHLAYFVGFDFLNVSVSDMGFQRTESTTTKPLFKYQEDNLRKYFSDSGFNSLDDVLVYLENNIAHFGEFKASANWTELKSSFLPTVAVIEDIPYSIHSSRLIYLALRPHIAYAEDTDIKTVLGETIYNEVKTEIVKDAPATKVTALLPYIRKPLIYLAAALLMEETGATLDNRGLFFEEISPTNSGNKVYKPTGPEVVSARVNRERMKAANYLEILKAQVAANWEEYETTTAVIRRNNTDKKTFWA